MAKLSRSSRRGVGMLEHDCVEMNVLDILMSIGDGALVRAARGYSLPIAIGLLGVWKSRRG